MISLLLTLLTLQWPPVPGAASYVVFWGHDRGFYTNAIPVVGTNASVPTIVIGEKYYFSVASVGANGIESISNNIVAINVPVTNWIHIVFTPQNSVNLSTWAPLPSYSMDLTNPAGGNNFREFLTITQTNISQ